VLFVVPLPLVRSVALGGILAVANALVGALVLLPALLAWLGPRVNRGALGRAPEHAGPSRAWAAIGEFANRHPWLTAGGCTLVLVLAALPALRMRAAMPDATTFPRGSEVRSVDERIADPAQFDPSGASALQIVLETDGPVLAPDTLRRVQAYLTRSRRCPGIATVDTALDALDPSQLGADGLVTTTDPTCSPSSTAPRRRSHADHAQGTESFRTYAAAELVGACARCRTRAARLEVTGPTAIARRRERHARALCVLVAIGVVGWNLAVLFAAFRSVLVPLKAALMNALSLAASFGVLVWVFQDGTSRACCASIRPTASSRRSRSCSPRSCSACRWTTRCSCSRGSRRSTAARRQPRSIVAGLAHTGRVISSAALILLVVIGAFAAGELVFVKEIGVGMSAAIALDVTLVRALLVPATMRLLGAGTGGRRAGWAAACDGAHSASSQRFDSRIAELISPTSE
jgi:RND superfamily putative drug exporter